METKELFKYASFNSALEIIKDGKMLMRHPDFFNDPFDCHIQNTLSFSANTFREFLYEKSSEVLVSNSVLPTKNCNLDFISAIKDCRVLAKLSPAAAMKKLKNKTKQLVDDVASEGLKRSSDPKWKELMRQMRILCVSEKFDNILMWSHYAKDHTGAVLGFKAPLSHFEKVNYVEIYPENILPEIFWAKRMLGQAVYNDDDMYKQQLLTKSKAWDYEEEWRIIISRPPSEPQPYVTDIAPLTSLYFGCRMSTSNKILIASQVKERFPDISIYEGHKHHRNYVLNFSPFNPDLAK